jgi:hypothetical protein
MYIQRPKILEKYRGLQGILHQKTHLLHLQKEVLTGGTIPLQHLRLLSGARAETEQFQGGRGEFCPDGPGGNPCQETAI